MNMKRLGVVCLVAVAAMVSSAHASDGDAKKGEKVFRKCKSCHMVGEGAKAKTGPVLSGVVGRPAGSWDGFEYSKGMKQVAESNLIWTPEKLMEFLTKPKAFIKGTKMTFAGLRKESERANVVAYLATFK